ncbi:5-oxoproline transporter, DUF979 family subunit [Sodalis-like endosymbiont of Proechinophthirus fluctus]|nr:DUF979 family protein [Sodalis-like endosymbiont of Proechinophthirus fluctus]
MKEGRRLLDAIVWDSVLPQVMVALRRIFVLAGVIIDVILLG